MKNKMIFDAVEFAVKAHTGQFRKGTTLPYIVHPLGVAEILIKNGCSEEIVAAGILHDTVEDTDTTIEDIKQSFGARVAQLVEGASVPDTLNTWEDKKRYVIEYLKTAPVDVLLVKIADQLHNIKSIREDYARVGESVFSIFNAPKESVQWYYQSLAMVFASRIDAQKGASLIKQFTAEVQLVFGDSQVRNEYKED